MRSGPVFSQIHICALCVTRQKGFISIVKNKLVVPLKYETLFVSAGASVSTMISTVFSSGLVRGLVKLDC